MKISRIKLKNVHQFKDLEIDLTYPNGHPKSGEPLDKVCFIGQGGTGKTTLLRLLNEAARTYISHPKGRLPITLNLMEDSICQFTLSNDLGVNCITEFNAEHTNVVWQTWHTLRYKGKPLIDESRKVERKPFDASAEFYSGRYFSFFFPVGFRYNNSLNEVNPQFFTIGDPNHGKADFGHFNVKLIWNEIARTLEAYTDELVTKLYNANKFSNGEREEKLKEFDQWEKENPSILKELGDRCLNRFLNKYHLEVFNEVDISQIKQFEFVPIKRLNSKDAISYSLLNSASLNIIYTAVPLFYFEPKNAVVLIDEVENSLYPDIQETIIEDYISIAPQNQFFFSTHSPIIASSFDPWEIIELKFDQHTGDVYQDNYLLDSSKGRTIDNYKFNPKHLSWSSILTKVYDLNSDGTTERQKKLTQLASVDELIKSKKNKGENIEEDVKKYIKLASELDWNL